MLMKEFIPQRTTHPGLVLQLRANRRTPDPHKARRSCRHPNLNLPTSTVTRRPHHPCSAEVLGCPSKIYRATLFFRKYYPNRKRGPPLQWRRQVAPATRRKTTATWPWKLVACPVLSQCDMPGLNAQILSTSFQCFVICTRQILFSSSSRFCFRYMETRTISSFTDIRQTLHLFTRASRVSSSHCLWIWRLCLFFFRGPVLHMHKSISRKTKMQKETSREPHTPLLMISYYATQACS